MRTYPVPTYKLIVFKVRMFLEMEKLGITKRLGIRNVDLTAMLTHFLKRVKLEYQIHKDHILVFLEDGFMLIYQDGTTRVINNSYYDLEYPTMMTLEQVGFAFNEAWNYKYKEYYTN